MDESISFESLSSDEHIPCTLGICVAHCEGCPNYPEKCTGDDLKCLTDVKNRMETCPKNYTCDCLCCPDTNECSGAKSKRFQTVLEHGLVAAARMVEDARKQAQQNFDYIAPKCKHRGVVNFRKKDTAASCSLKTSSFDWDCSFDSCPFTTAGYPIGGGEEG